VIPVLLQQQRRPPRPPSPTCRFDAGSPLVLQSGSWQCSAASTAWVLRSLGRPEAEADVVRLLGPGRISQTDGLLDGGGGGLVAVLRDLRLTADHAWVSYDEVLERAGRQPLAIGGVSWGSGGHWSAVRGRDGDTLLLANPSPGWAGVEQSMSREQFAALGPFAAVWVAVEEAAQEVLALPPVDASSPAAFVRSVRPYAERVERETGVPAAIMIAMAVNETGYGKFAAGNNFFGIKADRGWRGSTTGDVRTWEVVDGQRVDITDVFRAYPDPADSFRDFAAFLRENSRYRECWECTGDPRRFIEAIWAAGYATDPDYPAKIMAIAGDWELLEG
jgi:hypothetical protein